LELYPRKRFAPEYLPVQPPSRHGKAVEIEYSFDSKAGSFEAFLQQLSCISFPVFQNSVQRAIKCGMLRHEDHGPSTWQERRPDVPQCHQFVRNMFQHVDHKYRIKLFFES